MGTGIILCGVSLTRTPIPSGSPRTIGAIVGLSNIGYTVASQPNIHNDVEDNWIEHLFSCLAALNAVTCRLVTNTNDADWDDEALEAPGTWEITWPVEEGFTTGGSISFKGKIVSRSFGSPDIQGRIEGDITIQPSGKPTLTAGTPVT